MAVFPSQKYGFILNIIIVLSILVSVVLSSSAAGDKAEKKKKHCDFPAVFNFGDSNSDTGGLSAAFGQAGPPHGESFFHRPAGRYCDGRLIIDFIGKLNLFPIIPLLSI